MNATEVSCELRSLREAVARSTDLRSLPCETVEKCRIPSEGGRSEETFCAREGATAESDMIGFVVCGVVAASLRASSRLAYLWPGGVSIHMRVDVHILADASSAFP